MPAEPHRGRGRWAWTARLEASETAMRLTLLALLLQPIGDWRLRPWILGLAALGLLAPALARRSDFWGVLAGLAALRVALDWPLPDNHAYLLVYWCLAVAVARASRAPAVELARAGRLLVGLAFALAVVWKVLLSPDFLDGTFVRVALLADPRFEGFTRLAGGVDVATLDALRDGLLRHTDAAAPEPLSPALPVGLWRLGGALTVFTIAVESAVAVTWLWPRGGSVAVLRDAALLLFCLSVYSVATVAGFGWLLLAMGIAQSRPGAARAGYLAVFAVLLLYREIPIWRLLAEAFGV